MLIFTNRELDLSFDDESLLTRRYSPFSSTLNGCHVEMSGGNKRRWRASSVGVDVDDHDAVNRFESVFTAERPVLVFVHGNNTEPRGCFERCNELELQYGVSVIGFSWASEGYQPDGTDLSGVTDERLDTDVGEETLSYVSNDNLREGWIARKARRYGQAKDNAQYSAYALARFLRLVAAARLATMKSPYSIAAYSLGCHFLRRVIGIEGVSESLSTAHNIALLAACTGADRHTAWVEKLRPVGRVYIVYNNADSVLAAAKVVDHDTKLGANPGRERLSMPGYRYVDFEGAYRMPVGGHRFFVARPGKKLSKAARRLFGRVFGSEEDIRPGERVSKVYPLGCTIDGRTCHMAKSYSDTDAFS